MDINKKANIIKLHPISYETGTCRNNAAKVFFEYLTSLNKVNT